MPILIDPKKEYAVFKVYELRDAKPFEVDVFVLNKNENYQFVHKGLKYDFTLNYIKRWDGILSKHGAFYNLTVTKM